MPSGTTRWKRKHEHRELRERQESDQASPSVES
jgi:hypothetical protein